MEYLIYYSVSLQVYLMAAVGTNGMSTDLDLLELLINLPHLYIRTVRISEQKCAKTAEGTRAATFVQ